MRLLILTLAAGFFLEPRLAGDPVPVRRTQGSLHGFLVLETLEGKPLAVGDLVQLVHGDRATSRLSFHFHDGSLDEETAEYTQRGVLRLIRDHHVQHGPSFPESLDTLIDVSGREVVSHDKEGKSVHEHYEMDPDICNGILLTILLNLEPSAPPLRLSGFALARKPRPVHLTISSEGTEPFLIAGVRHKATNYRIKIELGGLAGAVAPLVGKGPADLHAWMLVGEAPAFVKFEGPFYADGPIWRAEPVAPVFPRVR